MAADSDPSAPPAEANAVGAENATVDPRPIPSGGPFDPSTLGVAGATTWTGRLDDLLIEMGLSRRAAVAMAAAAVVLGIVGWLWVRDAAPTAAETALPLATVPTGAVVTGSEATDSSIPGPVVVHVAGAVRSPGIHTLTDGARVADAIAEAGGARPRADLDRLNLAERLVDGTRVYVAVEGEPDVAVPAAGTASVGSGATAAPVDVNRAALDELDSLPGVGPATAQAIISEREANGAFASVDDLLRVRGIGDAKLAAMRDLVVV